MKSFIVAAMLVAAVAGQSFDMFKYGQEKSFQMNKPYGHYDMYKKMGYPTTDKTYMYEKDLVDLPYYMKDQFVDKKIFTLEELYTTQLFKEYMTLPLFREYITYPAFQRFVQSSYFQKFWTVPEFKQYFVNPVLFYKYVNQIVELFKYDATTYEQIVNKNVLPYVSGYEHDFYVPTVYNKDYLIQDGHYYKNLLDKVYSHLYNIDETTTVKKMVDPITGEIKMIPFGVEGIKGLDYTKDLVKDVLLKKFLINKNVDVDTIFGDKLITELLLKKEIDADLLKKIILTKDMHTTVFQDKIVKDLLLKKNVDVELLKDLLIKKDVDVELVKKLLLNKMINEKDMYTTTYTPEEMMYKEKMMHTFTPEEMMYKQKMMTTYTPEEMMYKEKMMHTFTPEEMMYKEKMMSPVYSRMMYNKRFPTYNRFDKFDTLDTVQKMNLFDILAKKEHFEIDPVDKMNVFDILSKKELEIKDKTVLNKILADKINEIEHFGTYETIPKMYNDVTKFERVPLTLEGVKPMMGVRTFDKKVFPEVIKA